MTIAVIGADAESVHTIEKAHALGLRVVTVDVDPKAPGALLADKAYVCDISREKEVIDLLKDEHVDLVCPTPIGRHLLTVGAVNDALGLPGISRDRINACIDKYAFHNRLRNVNLRSGHCYLIGKEQAANLIWRSMPELPDVPRQESVLAEDAEYPAILKPRYGSHGRSVHYLQDSAALKNLCARIWPDEETVQPEDADKKDGSVSDAKKDDGGKKEARARDHSRLAADFQAELKKVMEQNRRKASGEDDPKEEYILEQALPGTEYAVDGVVEGCNFEPVLIRRKTLTDPPARQAVSYMTLLPGDNPRVEDQIRTYMSRLCEVLGFTDCMLHADICIMGRTVNCIEVSPSPAGRHVYDEFIPMVTGVDVAEQYLRYMAGESHNFHPLMNKRMVLGYFDMENCFVHGIPTEDEIKALLPAGVRLRKWICNICLLDYLGSITDEASLLNRGCYIIEGENERNLTKAITLIREAFTLE